MHWKSIFVPVIALLLLSAAIPARSQVAPSATEREVPLTLGAGVSDYFIDWESLSHHGSFEHHDRNYRVGRLAIQAYTLVQIRAVSGSK